MSPCRLIAGARAKLMGDRATGRGHTGGSKWVEGRSWIRKRHCNAIKRSAVVDQVNRLRRDARSQNVIHHVFRAP
jgi:hypothetical protein